VDAGRELREETGFQYLVDISVSGSDRILATIIAGAAMALGGPDRVGGGEVYARP
jgi:hypothetical protein